MGKIITTCPEGHVTEGRCRCMSTHVERRQATVCGPRCSKQFPPNIERDTLTRAIAGIYDRHDRNAPLNHVNVQEWVEAVLCAGFKLVPDRS